ncbi:hypothetical protein J3R30DRAFT_2144909 [Lentinula aciculospora]|uniref:HTH CENPB-type domain-containing protein n=1 Tax=Lentinula aciculospora TaxID=153920 RepID=A0A9W9DRS0_9AGAR|nr:hypothetical protein J3R30DRAFT_2144909 [Lentinula aciculospora]
MSYAHRSTSGGAELVNNYQQLASNSSHQDYSSVLAGHRNYPSPSPSMSSSTHAPSPSAYSYPESQLDSSIGPSAPNRIMTRGQRKAAAAMNVTVPTRSQTLRFNSVYPLTPDSVSSTSAVTRQSSASPALSSISSHSHHSQGLIQQQPQYRMSMSPASPAIQPTAYGFHLPGPQPNSVVPSIGAQPPSRSTVSRPYVKPKQRKQRLFNVDRKAICEYHLAHPNEKQELIARQYGVERSTISKILKHKEKWLNIELGDARGCGTNGTGLPLRLAKHRPSKFPPVELEMQRWLVDVSDKYYASLPDPSTHPFDPQNPPPLHGPLSDASLREKARDIARSHGITTEQFKASSGWVENFKNRHGIKNGFWGGYLRNVQGRNAMAARGMGLGFPSTTPAPPPLASALASKLPSQEYRHISSDSKAEAPEEESDTEDEDEETDPMDLAYHQPPSSLSHLRDTAFSRPPWSTESSSTSASGESLMSTRSGQDSRPIYNDHPWSSTSTASHPPTPTEPVLEHYPRQHRRSVSGLSVATADPGSPYEHSQPTLEHVHAHDSSMSHGQSHVHHAQNIIEESQLQHHQHLQEQVQVHYATHSRQTSYNFTAAVDHSGPDMHPTADESVGSIVDLQSYPSEYASRQQQNMDNHHTSYAPQERSVQIEHDAPIQYAPSMHLQPEVHIQAVVEAPMPPPPPISDNSMPTLAECEEYLTKLCKYVDEGPGQGMLSLRRRDWLRKLKVVFFQAGSGIPITPDSDEEAS